MRSVLVITFLLFASQRASSQPREAPAAPKSDAEAVRAVREAAKSAEVHGIGVGNPAVYSFEPKEVKSWVQFVDLLRRKDGAAGRIWEALPKQTQEFAQNDQLVGKLDSLPHPADVTRLRSGVESTIRKLLRSSDFYTEKAFKDVALDKNLKDMLALGGKRTYLQTLRMNRELLTTAFPNHIAPVPANYHTIPVVVKRGKPVVLVLTSYGACQWQITVEDGAEVVGVILGGTEPQEIAGVKVPVVYRVGRWPDGKDRWGQGWETIWTCRDPKDKSFAELESGVKKVLDKSFSEFQATDDAPKEGFVVKPSAK